MRITKRHIKLGWGLTIVSVLLAFIAISLKYSHEDPSSSLRIAQTKLETEQKAKPKAEAINTEDKITDFKVSTPNHTKKAAQNTEAKQTKENIVEPVKVDLENISTNSMLRPAEENNISNLNNNEFITTVDNTSGNNQAIINTEKPAAPAPYITEAIGVQSTSTNLYAGYTNPQTTKQAAQGGPPPEEGGGIPPVPSLPLGDGISILLILAGSYILLKRTSIIKI